MNQTIKIQKSPKLFSQWIRKRYYKTLGTGVIKSPMFLCVYLSRLKFKSLEFEIYSSLEILKLIHKFRTKYLLFDILCPIYLSIYVCYLSFYLFLLIFYFTIHFLKFYQFSSPEILKLIYKFRRKYLLFDILSTHLSIFAIYFAI